MITGTKGLELIKLFEGCKLKPYLCPANVPTIGYGSTKYANGVKVTLRDKTITEIEAENLLKNTLKVYEDIVNKKIKVTLNQNQFDSLVSYTYNTGGSDTLFKLINNKASDFEIRRWFQTHYITGGGKELPGLVRRRKAEADLYFTK